MSGSSRDLKRRISRNAALPGVAAAHADAGASAESPFVISDNPFNDAELATLGEVAALDPLELAN